MCGRFVQAEPPDVYARFFGATTVKTEALAPSYNVAPTDRVYAVAEHRGERQLGSFRWGLLPWWAKDRKVAARNINARAETVATKASFKRSFVEGRRCIVPADGFYEWERKPKGKLPHFIHHAGGEPLSLAGLWSSWRDPETGERVATCTIITGPPDGVVSRLHDRMPVVLPADAWDRWLDPEFRDEAELLDLVQASPTTILAEHAVSTLVNKVANNVPELVAPLETPVVDL